MKRRIHHTEIEILQGDITEMDTEYFLVFGEERHQYAGMNYCPFCGRILSRALWNLEKKK